MNPTTVIEASNQASPQNQDLWDASCKFFQDTVHNPHARARQAAAIADGCVVGGLQAIPDRVINHPAETVNDAMFGAGTGALFGMAGKIESPAVAGVLLVGGAAMTLGYAWDLGRRLGQDQDLQSSLDNIWRSSDWKTYASALPTVENSLGKESFNLALTSLSAGVGANAVTWAGDAIGPMTAAASKPCLHGAPNAMAKEILPSANKPDNAYAMVWHRDRLGFEWDRLEPQALEQYIQKTTLSERLDKIESSIKKGKLFEAYDHAGANLKWHQERSGSYGDQDDQLAQQFWKIGMSIRNSWDEPNNGWLSKAHEQIALTRQQFGNDIGWPLKVAPEKMLDVDRLYHTPLSQRVDEIQALVNSNMLKDATRLTNKNYVLHRGQWNYYFNSSISGTANELYNPAIADRFDMLQTHLIGVYTPYLKDVVPDASLATINQQLAELKKM